MVSQAQKIFQGESVFCAYACGFSDTRKAMPSHESFCSKRPLYCPNLLSKSCSLPTTVLLNSNDLTEHLFMHCGGIEAHSETSPHSNIIIGSVYVTTKTRTRYEKNYNYDQKKIQYHKKKDVFERRSRRNQDRVQIQAPILLSCKGM